MQAMKMVMVAKSTEINSRQRLVTFPKHFNQCTPPQSQSTHWVSKIVLYPQHAIILICILWNHDQPPLMTTVPVLGPDLSSPWGYHNPPTSSSRYPPILPPQTCYPQLFQSTFKKREREEKVQKHKSSEQQSVNNCLPKNALIGMLSYISSPTQPSVVYTPNQLAN